MALTFQNDYVLPVSICIELYDPGKCPEIGWSKAGWYNIESGKSWTVILGDLNNRYYYFFARASDGTEWNGNRRISVPKTAFYTCLDTVYLNPMIVGLREIDTGGHADIIVRLIARGRTKVRKK